MLISDDASTDDTGAICKSFLSDMRIRYVQHSQNRRQAANWEYAIEQTKGEIVATLHADDVWKPNALATYARHLRSGSIDMVWGGWLRVNAALKPLAHQPSPLKAHTYPRDEAVAALLCSNPSLPSALAFRRHLSENAGMPEPRYGMLCDREYALRLAKYSNSARAVSEQLMLYRVHPNSITNVFTRDGRLALELDDLETRLPALLEGISGKEQLLLKFKASIADWNFRQAMTLKLAGEHEAAKRRLRHALASDPWLLTRASFFVKWILCHGGKIGEQLLGRVHGRNAWVSEESQ